jgi:hypothetical protein
VFFEDVIEPRLQGRAEAVFCYVGQGVFRDILLLLVNSEKQVMSQMEQLSVRYIDSLGSEERAIYEALREHERDAFRITRDLASASASREFFLSYDHLAHRLGILAMQAFRIMCRLQSYGILRLVKKGTRRTAETRSQTSVWKWLLADPANANTNTDDNTDVPF